MSTQVIPGTTLPLSSETSMFEAFRPLIRATNGLTLSQVCAITALESSTIQNWVKRGFVAKPQNKKYHERQLARILLISALRDAMKIDTIGELMAMVNGSANDEKDDIIPEDKMYDYFCQAVAKTDLAIPSLEEIPDLADETVKNYVEPYAGAKNKLKDALCVMVLAYSSAKYKQQAEALFDSMRSKVSPDCAE